MATNTAGEEFCSKCGALNPTFDEIHRFYACSTCGSVWAYDKDDPDYEETGHGECPNCFADEIHITWSKSDECNVCDICGMEF